ncbi:transglycosylase domain-containing protein [Catellatospora sp. KI3]|uniref:transglycosylase domain-containing protein n=1 Tax=Catellatospora sp. KI3 TaxID=3041620 RepID=UPI002482F329|nr:transglycosylase domain-containing protein [Catellatospora sp. KI3]MDI1461809.1 transglycosylase domain-containing protein [Catellatospora sp. KI3]
MTDIELEQPPLPRRYVKRRAIAGGLLGVLALTGAGAVAASFYYDSVPVPHLEDFRPANPQVNIALMSPQARLAFVAAVDGDFYEQRSPLHASPITLGCLAAMIRDRSVDSDGSWRGRIMADKLEARYSRNEILGCYLNSAEFAPGVVGVASAVHDLTDHEPATLTTAEAVLLAGRLSPLGGAAIGEQEAAQRKGEIVQRMVQHGWLTDAEAHALGFFNPDPTGRPA